MSKVAELAYEAMRNLENFTYRHDTVVNGRYTFYSTIIAMFDAEASKLYIASDAPRTCSTINRMNTCIELYMGVDWLKLKTIHGELNYVHKHFDTVVGIDELGKAWTNITDVITYMREHG